MFTLENVPLSYGSNERGDYRLRDYAHLPERELVVVERHLWNFSLNRAETIIPLNFYNNLPYINSGWENSVFELDEHRVIKIPAQVFPEVNDPR